jgi:hypothetical protein
MKKYPTYSVIPYEGNITAWNVVWRSIAREGSSPPAALQIIRIFKSREGITNSGFEVRIAWWIVGAA